MHGQLTTPVELTDVEIDRITDALNPQRELIEYGWSAQERVRMNRIFERFEDEMSESEVATFVHVLNDMDERSSRTPEQDGYFWHTHLAIMATLLGKLKDARK